MAKLIDLNGQQINAWKVGPRVFNISRSRPREVYFECTCICGTMRSVSSRNLKTGATYSCGCVWKNNMAQGLIGNGRISRDKHGENYMDPKSPWINRATGIKRRCMAENIPFGFDSIHELACYLVRIAPTHCPVFGVLLEKGTGGFSPSSPSVDRIDPCLGYVKGNLQVISMKANTMKSYASAEDLRNFAKWVLLTVPNHG